METNIYQFKDCIINLNNVNIIKYDDITKPQMIVICNNGSNPISITCTREEYEDFLRIVIGGD